MMHVPRVIEIKRIEEETPTVKTFVFDWDITDERPGQFMMVWNFADEKPMSISNIDPVAGEIWLSVKNVGSITHQLHSLKEGDKIGLRGPYGRPFQMEGSKMLAVGGGIGMAPIFALATEASRTGQELEVISAAVTQEELLFMEKLEKIGITVHPATDDGSCGFCGFPTLLTEALIKDGDFDLVLGCGPEPMMKGLFEIVEKYNIPSQFSLERYMKCAVGICGQCCVDDVGWRVCAEGPVFWGHELRMITEFGHYKRDSSGIKHIF
ncbi:MAG TPA: dihydroorotate dehydrogenase electron transfer subunit [Methanobacteriaceae archaeon]|nr:dihydroorotate dehydrogenase electron transfer subunit [Methanobacteriaceae archaeon]